MTTELEDPPTPPSTPAIISGDSPANSASAEDVLQQACMNLVPPTPPSTPMVSYIDRAVDETDDVNVNLLLPLSSPLLGAAKELPVPREETVIESELPATADQVPSASSAPFTNLVILPPLQRNNDDMNITDAVVNGMVVTLPPLRAEEPVASIRAALSELVHYAHYTHYRLQLETVVVPESTDKQAAATATATLTTQHKAGTTHSNHGGNGKHPAKKSKKGSNSNKVGKEKSLTTVSSHKEDFISIRYTTSNAVICNSSPLAAAQEGSTEENINKIYLNDYGDLTPISDILQQYSDASDGKRVGFRIVLERYDAASVKDHVARCKSLLDGNPPCLETLMDDKASSEEDVIEESDKEEHPEVSAPPEEPSTASTSQEQEEENENKEQDEEDKDEKQLKDPRLPLITTEDQFHVDGTNVVDFYNLSCGENEDLDKLLADRKMDKEDEQKKKKKSSGVNGSINAFEEKETERPSMSVYLAEMSKLDAECKTNWRIQYSGFHPPPAHRRMLGDLAYLEVIPPTVAHREMDNDALLTEAQSRGVIHITACAAGFYVNRTAVGVGVRKGFNPSPAEDSCYSHCLLDCVLQRSELFRKAWVSQLMPMLL